MGYSEAICNLNTGMNAKKADSKKPYFRVAQVRDALKAEALKPLTIKETDLNSGIHAVALTPQGLEGGADPRREGVAAGE